MMYQIDQVILVSLTLFLTSIRSHVIWESPNELQPVHGLYVKPSFDGTTGDLYVAATEDNGQKSQWLTDQPINFLPKHQTKTPVSLTSSVTKTTSPKEEIITTKKRAVITSPAIKYAYALPIQGAEENIVPYPYAIPGNPPIEASMIPPYSPDISTPPYAFSYLYPHIMSAIASAMNSYKESDSNEENNPNPAPPFWPHGYGYPYPYFIIDPVTWAQRQENVSPSEVTSASSNESS